MLVLFIIEAKVNGRVFMKLNETSISRLNVSFGFESLVLDIIQELVHNYSHN